MTRLTVLVAALAAGPAAAQRSVPAAPLPADGTELFRGLLAYHGLTPVDPAGLRPADYADVAVVVIGVPSPAGGWRTVDAAPYVRSALAAGGAVFVACESPFALDGLVPGGEGVRVTGEAVTCPRPDSTFDRNPACPFAVPPLDLSGIAAMLDPNRRPPAELALFAGRKQVATNRPSAVDPGTGRGVLPLAGFPKGCVADGKPLAAGRQLAVAVPGRFRFALVADSSVVINQPMAAAAPDDESKPGTDNLAFANAVAGWLAEDKKRTRCVFVEYGRVQTRFDKVVFAAAEVPPLPVPPIPPLSAVWDKLIDEQPRLTDAANQVVARAEDRDVVNENLVGEDGRRFPRLARFLAGLLGVVAAAWLVRRLFSGRTTHAAAPPPEPAKKPTAGPEGTFAHRKAEVLQAGSYTAAVRDYLALLFADRGYAVTGDRPPKFPAGGPLHDQLHTLWKVAAGVDRRPVTFTRWKELEPMIDAARQAAADGRWPAGGGAA